MQTRFYAYMNMELLACRLFVHISIRCIVSNEHTHSQTHKHVCIQRSLSVVPGFSVPVLSFFLLVVILLDFFIVLALVRSYVRIPAIIIVRHIHAIKIHFTFEFVCVDV